MVEALSDEQVLASVDDRDLYIEAFPGSGKTTVAAKRFGVLRFKAANQTDARGVAATSFTRAATREIHNRIARTWGLAALQWPHRVSTVDALIVDFVHGLLRTGALQWPGGHRTIEVHDTWYALTNPRWERREHVVTLTADAINVNVVWRSAAASRPPADVVSAAVHAGACTHDEMRAVLELALLRPDLRAAIAEHLATSFRAIVVDEVFDANPLDLKILHLAGEAGVDLTLIGDPWQALYGFRGASPALVPRLVETLGCATRQLSHSYRWASDSQRDLAAALREGLPGLIPVCDPDPGQACLDVVIACEWKHLWRVSPKILPLAFSGGRGSAPEAAATVLLDAFTRSALGVRATNVNDALRRLDLIAGVGLETSLQELLARVRREEELTAGMLYSQLVDVLARYAAPLLPRFHWKYRERLEWLISRIRDSGPFVPGVTAHQAKGQEWDVVGLALPAADRERLVAGLNRDVERHRQLYVACTRARYLTTLLDVPE